MTKFKNGDVLRYKSHHPTELVFMSYIPKSDGAFIAWSDDENDYDVYTDEQWRIKPKKEKRWIAVFPDDYIYPIPYQNKNTLMKYVAEDHNAEYAAKAQYIQIEVEV